LGSANGLLLTPFLLCVTWHLEHSDSRGVAGVDDSVPVDCCCSLLSVPPERTGTPVSGGGADGGIGAGCGRFGISNAASAFLGRPRAPVTTPFANRGVVAGVGGVGADGGAGRGICNPASVIGGRPRGRITSPLANRGVAEGAGAGVGCGRIGISNAIRGRPRGLVTIPLANRGVASPSIGLSRASLSICVGTPLVCNAGVVAA
jgi:hypothetical protein